LKPVRCLTNMQRCSELELDNPKDRGTCGRETSNTELAYSMTFCGKPSGRFKW
jgi:hypothetical protein